MGIADGGAVFEDVIDRAGQAFMIEGAEVAASWKLCGSQAYCFFELVDLPDIVFTWLDVAQQLYRQCATPFCLFDKEPFTLGQRNGLADVAEAGVQSARHDGVGLTDILGWMLEVCAYFKPKKV